MRRALPVLVLIAVAGGLWAQSDPRIRTFTGRGFTFGFAEPEGWMIDREAAQLAHFVLHEAGVGWREAPAVLFVRLQVKEHGDVEEFVQENVRNFQDTCPAFEIKDVELSVEASHDFITKSYDCAGMRHEMVAVTEVPRYFVLFVLSARTRQGIAQARPKYEKVLSTFFWRQRNARSLPPDNPPPGG